MTDSEKQEIYNLYLIKNLTINEIADKLFLSYKQVYSCIKNNGWNKTNEQQFEIKHRKFLDKYNLSLADEKYIIELYITENLSKLEIMKKLNIPECAINTIIKYNHLKKSPKQIAEIKKKTMFYNYGVTNVWQLESVKNKIKETNLKRYGVVSPLQNKSVSDKMKTTHNSKSEKEKNDINLKISNTKLSKSKEEKEAITEKIKQTKKERYNDENYRNDEKIKQTNLNKYGYENVMQNDEIKQKVKNKWLEKYQVQHISQRHLSPEILNIISNENNLKKFIVENSIKYYYQLTEYLGMSTSHVGKLVHKFNLDYLLTKLQSRSKFEIALNDFICLMNKRVINNDRQIIAPQEIDLFVIDDNFGIEFNGNYWHYYDELDDSRKLNKLYHQQKSLKAQEKGIFIYHIFEYEWTDERKQSIIKSQIINLCHKTQNRIYARNCEIKEIKDNNLIRDFLNDNHLQGYRQSKVKLGLFYDNELVSLMTFGKPYLNKSNQYEWELYRFCNKLNTLVIGGFDKLFKYFIRNYNPCSILTYSDFAKGDGHTYEKMGFKKIGLSKPNYVWWSEIGHQNFILSRYQTQMKNEIEIMKNRGYAQIFDCGNYIWVWTND